MACICHLQELLRCWKVVFLETVDITAIEAGTRATRHDELSHVVLPEPAKRNGKQKVTSVYTSQPTCELMSTRCSKAFSNCETIGAFQQRNKGDAIHAAGMCFTIGTSFFLRYTNSYCVCSCFLCAPACFQHIQASVVVDLHVSVLRMERPHQRPDVPYAVCSFASLVHVLGDGQVSLLHFIG